MECSHGHPRQTHVDRPQRLELEHSKLNEGLKVRRKTQSDSESYYEIRESESENLFHFVSANRGPAPDRAAEMIQSGSLRQPSTRHNDIFSRAGGGVRFSEITKFRPSDTAFLRFETTRRLFEIHT